MSLDFTAVSALLAVLRGAKLLKDASGWLALPEASALERAVKRTAETFAGRFPDLARQLRAAATSADFQVTLEEFVTRGVADPGQLALHLQAAGLHLVTPEEHEAAREAISCFLEEFNKAQFTDPGAGSFVADSRSAARDALLSEQVEAVQGTADRTATMVQRIEALTGADPSDDLVALRAASRNQPLTAVLAMCDLLEQQFRRRTGFYTRPVEAQLHLERGAAAWRSGDALEAAKYFDRAYELDPRDTRIRLNSGLALAVNGNVDEGLARIDRVIEGDPSNVRALIAKAQVLHIAGRDAEALALLRPLTNSPGSDSDPFRLHVGAAMRQGLFSEAVEVAERGLGHSQDAACLALVGFAYAARADASYRAAHVDQQVELDLQRARAALERAAPAARRENAPRILKEVLVAHASVLLQSGLPDDAIARAREALVVVPKDTDTEMSVAAVALATRRFDEAFAITDPLAKSGHSSARVAAIAAYCGLNPTASARQVEDMLRSVGLDPETAPFPAFELLLDAALRESSLVAETLSAKWRGASPVHQSLVFARVALAKDEAAEATQYLGEAIEGLKQAPDPASAMRVADCAHKHGMSALAVAAYDTIPVAENSPEFLVAGLVNALLALDDSEAEPRIMALAARASKRGIESAPVLHAEALVLERRGELGRAQELWATLAAHAPSPPKYWLAVARCAYRRQLHEEATAALARLSYPTSLTATELLMVAELRRRLGQYEAALRDAYAAIVTSPGDRAVEFAYVVFVMGLPQEATAHLKFDAVADGSIVALDFGKGEEHFVALGVSPAMFDATFYPSSSEEVRCLVGKQVGDVVTWTTGPGGALEARIGEIFHPYGFAARRLLVTLQHRFPGKSPISAIDVGDDFQEPKRILAEQQADHASILEFARTNPVTLALLAKRMGRDLFRVWSSLETLPFRVLVSRNTKVDIDAEAAALAGARGVVLDPLALLDLKALGLFDRIARRFSALLVPQVSIDLIAECRDAILADSARGDLLTVGVQHGDLAPTVITRSQLESAAAFLDDILSFCRDRCTSSARPRTYSTQEAALLDAVTEPFLVPLMVAGERAADGICLFSDEAILRALARTSYRVGAASVLTFADAELQRGAMSPDEHADVMRFCLRRMRHVTLTAGYLTHLVVTSRSLAEYSVAIDALLDPELPREPALRVAVGHIRQVAMATSVWEGAAGYLQVLLMRMVRRHGRLALAVIKKLLESPRFVAVPNIQRAIRLIAACEKARWEPDRLLL